MENQWGSNAVVPFLSILLACGFAVGCGLVVSGARSLRKLSTSRPVATGRTTNNKNPETV
jgi:hypothetical protein